MLFFHIVQCTIWLPKTDALEHRKKTSPGSPLMYTPTLNLSASTTSNCQWNGMTYEARCTGFKLAQNEVLHQL